MDGKHKCFGYPLIILKNLVYYKNTQSNFKNFWEDIKNAKTESEGHQVNRGVHPDFSRFDLGAKCI